jgi:chromosome partitioning protein
MKTLALANQKGGVGKSAVAVQLAFYFALVLNKRVLFIDLDHQKNATKPIIKAGKASVASFTASQMLAGLTAPLPAGNFVIVQGDAESSTLERQPDKHNGFANSFKSFIESVDDRFDVCIIDTNPNPDIRYASALLIADYLLSPIELNQEALDGIGSLLNHQRYGYKKIKQVMNPKLELIGILPNKVEATQFHKGNFEQLATHYAQLLIPLSDRPGNFAMIQSRTAIPEAQAEGVPIWQLRQAVPKEQEGKVDPASMPVRTAARDAWKALKPVFDVVAKRMGI